MSQLSHNRTIGIWIELYRSELGSEGIGRLLRFVIEGAAKSGYRFVLACPSWYRQQLEEYIDEFDNATQSSVSVLCVRQQPAILTSTNPQTLTENPDSDCRHH